MSKPIFKINEILGVHPKGRGGAILHKEKEEPEVITFTSDIVKITIESKNSIYILEPNQEEKEEDGIQRSRAKALN